MDPISRSVVSPDSAQREMPSRPRIKDEDGAVGLHEHVRRLRQRTRPVTLHARAGQEPAISIEQADPVHARIQHDDGTVRQPLRRLDLPEHIGPGAGFGTDDLLDLPALTLHGHRPKNGNPRGKSQERQGSRRTTHENHSTPQGAPVPPAGLEFEFELERDAASAEILSAHA